MSFEGLCVASFVALPVFPSAAVGVWTCTYLDDLLVDVVISVFDSLV